MTVNILADSNIPYIAEACAHLGDITLFVADDASALHKHLRSADVLLCRSTIRVDRSLLEGTAVRFVATATSGAEHVDEPYLLGRGIRFTAARGSNAQSVAEYVFTALFALAAKHGFSLRGKKIGIIGAGHVGTWVAHLADQLGMACILNDPPKFDATANPIYRPLEEALDADIVTLHVPLTKKGRHPTFHLFNQARFSALKNGAIFLNTARGDVLSPRALRAHVSAHHLNAVVLDVFPSEPRIDASLIQIADIATPHIAGHSYDGKLLGTQMVYEDLCLFLETEPQWNYQSVLPEAPALIAATKGSTPERMVDAVLSSVYNIWNDDRSLRFIPNLPLEAQKNFFSSLRRFYPVRREFHTQRLSGDINPDARTILHALGFQIE
jgi:erythronate-4-phosphate dehydrogenase